MRWESTNGEEHIELLKGYGWIVPVDGYRLTSVGRSSSTRGV